MPADPIAGDGGHDGSAGHAGLETLGLAWDAWRATRDGGGPIRWRQQARLAALVAFARAASPFYREHYRLLPARVERIGDLPPTTKQGLMARFDDWPTDSAVTRAGIDAWIADPTRIGRLFLGRYLVYTTSGTTGEPAILLQDRRSLALLDALRVRLLPAVLTGQTVRRLVGNRARAAAVFATGGHFGGVALVEWQRGRHPLARDLRVFPVTTPLPDLVAALNAFRPALLGGYASAVVLLAHEQRAGRLRIAPALVSVTAETLAPADRALIETAFGCRVVEGYGASEAPAIAFDCRLGRLHANADWFLIEPVDRAHRPVPPGEPSQTVLVTNLINRVQPVIRYDLGDSVTVLPERCACGSPLPLIRVEGRTDEVLAMPARDGRSVRLLPLALGTVVEETPGVYRFQAIRTAPTTLSIRLEEAAGADRAAVWAAVAARLRTYLTEQGLPNVEVELAAERPARGASGKFRHVWSEVASPARPAVPGAG